MKNNARLRHLGRFFKLFVIGSFVATRTASGSADPDDSLRHELAWMTVRDRLSDVVSENAISGEIRRMVEEEVERSIDFRVNYTYQAIAPNEIAELDTLWMDHLAGLGVGADEMDQFLEARSVALRLLVQDKSEVIDGPDQVRDVIREFSRSDYTG